MRMLDVDELVRRLDTSLATLTGGARDLPPRQQALRSTIAWSYDLLDEPDQRLFARLGVFAGGFALEAAEAICADERVPAVFDGISSLVDKALLRPDHSLHGQPRFAMLQVIREYADDRLAAAGERDELRRLHAGFYRQLVLDASRQLRTGEMRPAVAQHIADEGNIRTALQWFVDTHDGDAAAQMGLATWPLWFMQGRYTEGLETMERALEADLVLSDDSRADVMLTLGMMAFERGDYDRAGSVLRPALDRYVQRGDAHGAATASVPLGVIAALQHSGDGDSMLRRSIDDLRRLDDQWELALRAARTRHDPRDRPSRDRRDRTTRGGRPDRPRGRRTHHAQQRASSVSAGRTWDSTTSRGRRGHSVRRSSSPSNSPTGRPSPAHLTRSPRWPSRPATPARARSFSVRPQACAARSEPMCGRSTARAMPTRRNDYMRASTTRRTNNLPTRAPRSRWTTSWTSLERSAEIFAEIFIDADRYIRGVFAWLMRLLIAGCMGALVYAFAPAAVDNFRATELGIHGMVTVTSCDRGDCRGSFTSDNGEVSRTDLELLVGSINDVVGPGATVECWITDPSAGRGYVSRFWLLHTLSMSLLVLLFSLGLLLLTPDRVGRSVRVRAAVQEAAASSDLGASEGSIDGRSTWPSIPVCCSPGPASGWRSRSRSRRIALVRRVGWRASP